MAKNRNKNVNGEKSMTTKCKNSRPAIQAKNSRLLVRSVKLRQNTTSCVLLMLSQSTKEIRISPSLAGKAGSLQAEVQDHLNSVVIAVC